MDNVISDVNAARRMLFLRCSSCFDRISIGRKVNFAQQDHQNGERRCSI